MKILLTGSTGFVGASILKAYKDSIITAPSLRDLSEDQIRRIVQDSGAEAIIHTAAISQIPVCENNPEASYYANVQIPVFLARAAGHIKLICFSSDQVYSGSDDLGPYREEDAKPSNIYSVHKLEMEKRVLDICPDAVMLRAEWMYDNNCDRETYYSIVKNAANPLIFSSAQYRGVTWRKEVADAMAQVIHLPGGAYNFGSETDQSMYEITREFLQYLGMEISVTDGPPRHNLWMDCGKAKQGGVQFSTVLDGLMKCDFNRAADRHVPSMRIQ